MISINDKLGVEHFIVENFGLDLNVLRFIVPVEVELQLGFNNLSPVEFSVLANAPVLTKTFIEAGSRVNLDRCFKCIRKGAASKKMLPLLVDKRIIYSLDQVFKFRNYLEKQLKSEKVSYLKYLNHCSIELFPKKVK